MQVGLRVAVFAVGFAVACGGQSLSRGNDDDDDDDIGGSGSSNGGSNAGGSSNGGSSSGGIAVGGMDSRGGSGFAGSGSAGVPSCAQPLDAFVLAAGCDVPSAMTAHCARSGCHNANFASAGLNLAMDEYLVARILDVPARFAIITAGVTPCTPETCPLPGGVMFVDSRIPEASWMLRKMADYDFSASSGLVDMGCGSVMPMPPGTSGFTPERKACLDEFFLAIARLGTPCAVSSADEARPPTPPPPPPCPPEGLR